VDVMKKMLFNLIEELQQYVDVGHNGVCLCIGDCFACMLSCVHFVKSERSSQQANNSLRFSLNVLVL